MRRLLLFLAVIVGILILAEIAYMVRGVRETEMNLSAAHVALEALSGFVYEHHRWPNSKLEFEKFVRIDGTIEWPEKSDRVFSRINIEFGLSLNEVIARGRNSFPVQVKGNVPMESFSVRVEQFLRFVSKEIENGKRKQEKGIEENTGNDPVLRN